MNAKTSNSQNESKNQIRTISLQLINSLFSDMKISNPELFINDKFFNNSIKTLQKIFSHMPLNNFTYINNSSSKYINQSYKTYNNIALFKYSIITILISFLTEIQINTDKPINIFLENNIHLYLRLYKLNIFTYENIAHISLFLYYLSFRKLNLNNSGVSPFQTNEHLHIELIPLFIYSVKLFIKATSIKPISEKETELLLMFINNVISIIDIEEYRYLFYYNDIHTTQFTLFSQCVRNIPLTKRFKFECMYIMLLSKLYRFNFTYDKVMLQFVSPFEKMFQGIKVKSYKTLLNEIHIANMPMKYVVDVNGFEKTLLKKEPKMLRDGFYFNALNSGVIKISDISTQEDKDDKGVLIVFSFKILPRYDDGNSKYDFDLFYINEFKIDGKKIYGISFRCEYNKNKPLYKMILYAHGPKETKIYLQPNENYVFYTLIKKKEIEIRYYDENNIEKYETISKSNTKTTIPSIFEITIGEDIELKKSLNQQQSRQFNGYIGSILLIPNAGELFKVLYSKKILGKLGSNYSVLYYLQFEYENLLMYYSNELNELIAQIPNNRKEIIKKDGKCLLINSDTIFSECVGYEYVNILMKKVDKKNIVNKNNVNSKYVNIFVSDNSYNSDVIGGVNAINNSFSNYGNINSGRVISGDLICNNCLYGKVKAGGLYTKEIHPFKHKDTVNEFINCNGISLISLEFEYMYQIVCRINEDENINEELKQNLISNM